MSLYGYGLAYYLVDAYIGVPISGVGRVDSLWILLVGNAWGREWTLLGMTLHKRGALDGKLDC
jgi:hypothetical protein